MFEARPTHSTYGGMFLSSMHLDPLTPFITDGSGYRTIRIATRSQDAHTSAWSGRKDTSTTKES